MRDGVPAKAGSSSFVLKGAKMDINEQIPGAKSFRWREFIRSATATKRGIDNMPRDDAVWTRIEYLAKNVLQPLRDEFGPIRINSGYRCPALNRAVGSSNSSFHAYGMAADIVPLEPSASFTVRDMFVFVHDNLPYTELIAEEWPGGWTHVALEKGRDSEHQLKYKRVGGRVTRATFKEIMGMFK